jgi:SAM-dependent methyltransferase
VTAAKRQAQQAPMELEISTFPAKWDALNRLSAAYMANALVELGAFARPGERHTPQTLLDQFNILPTYQALMARWLMHLTGCGWLQTGEDGAMVAARPLQALPVESLQAEAQALFADAPYLTEYINDCGQRLAGIITGKESPLEMMFPGGSMQRAEDLYQNWAHARYFNQIVGAVAEAVSHANPGRALRLLEIGAGTGATTAAVLPLLPPSRSVYHFTDVSDLFLDRARKKFAAYPFVQYGLLDAEKSGLEQGYGQGQFDVVIAANVIHATRSLSETMQHTRGLLAPGGVLVLFEATTHQPWYDITTGLIEGWQSFGDDLRANSPLLSAAQWEQILRAEGFEDVVSLPPAGSPAEVLGESVILARPLHQGEVVEASLQLYGGHAAEPEPEALPADDLMLRLREALPDERKEILLDLVRGHVVGVLRLDADEAPDRKARLMDLGVDSLMAVELRGRLSLSLNLERKLPATLIFDYPTIEAITDYLLRDVLVLDQPEASVSAAESAKPLPTTSVDIDNLTDEQVEAMLLAKLKKMK